MSYNPYIAFKDIFNEIKEVAGQADIEIGELKRDLTDFKVIKAALSKLPEEYVKELKKTLEDKVQEINNDVEDLLKFKAKIRDERRQLSSPDSKKEALERRSDPKWKKIDAIFKFIARYGYLELISEIEKISGNKKPIAVTEPEITKIEKVVNNDKFGTPPKPE